MLRGQPRISPDYPVPSRGENGANPKHKFRIAAIPTFVPHTPSLTALYRLFSLHPSKAYRATELSLYSFLTPALGALPEMICNKNKYRSL